MDNKKVKYSIVSLGLTTALIMSPVVGQSISLANNEIISAYQDNNELLERNIERLEERIGGLNNREDRQSLSYQEELNYVYDLYQSEYVNKGLKEKIASNLFISLENLKEESLKREEDQSSEDNGLSNEVLLNNTKRYNSQLAYIDKNFDKTKAGEIIAYGKIALGQEMILEDHINRGTEYSHR